MDGKIGPINLRGGASFQHIMRPTCIHCGNNIRNEDGIFYALPSPYFGLIHRQCAPFHLFDGEWPHQETWAHYQARGVR